MKIQILDQPSLDTLYKQYREFKFTKLLTAIVEDYQDYPELQIEFAPLPATKSYVNNPYQFVANLKIWNPKILEHFPRIKGTKNKAPTPTTPNTVTIHLWKETT
jgi:hypothetical protein